LPIGQGNTFQGIIDLIREVAIYYSMEEKDRGNKWEEKPIPEDMKEMAAQWRQTLVERVAETDDALTEKYLGGEAISNEELVTALRKATIAFKLHPVFCGSALNYVGIQPLLD